MFNNGDCCADGHVAKELEIMIRDNPSSGQPYHSSTCSTNRLIDSIQFDQTGMECEWLSNVVRRLWTKFPAAGGCGIAQGSCTTAVFVADLLAISN